VKYRSTAAPYLIASVFAALAALASTPRACAGTEQTQPPPAVPAYMIPDHFEEIVLASAAETGVPVWIAARLLERESGWRADAVGHNVNGTRDLGIAQLNDRYLNDFAVFNGWAAIDPFDPTVAIPVAIRYLAHLQLLTGSWEGAVAAYNCGLGRYRTGDIPASTLRHVAAVMGDTAAAIQ